MEPELKLLLKDESYAIGYSDADLCLTVETPASLEYFNLMQARGVSLNLDGFYYSLTIMYGNYIAYTVSFQDYDCQGKSRKEAIQNAFREIKAVIARNCNWQEQFKDINNGDALSNPQG